MADTTREDRARAARIEFGPDGPRVYKRWIETGDNNHACGGLRPARMVSIAVERAVARAAGEISGYALGAENGVRAGIEAAAPRVCTCLSHAEREACARSPKGDCTAVGELRALGDGIVEIVRKGRA